MKALTLCPRGQFSEGMRRGDNRDLMTRCYQVAWPAWRGLGNTVDITDRQVTITKVCLPL